MSSPTFPLPCRFAAVLFFLCLFLVHADAQRTQRFRGGLIGGLTVSQIDGDDDFGYHKPGLQAGARAVVLLNRRWEVSVDLLFAQRGSQPRFFKDEANPFFFSITQNYLEVPVLIHLKDWFAEDGDGDAYHKISLDAGLVYGRLFSARINNDFDPRSTALPHLKDNDVAFSLGASFNINRHLGFIFRYMRSFGTSYDPQPGAWNKGFKGHGLGIAALYLF